jgi:hypothetical protein
VAVLRPRLAAAVGAAADAAPGAPPCARGDLARDHDLVARDTPPGEDQTLILADVGRKAIVQVEGFTRRLLERRMEPERAREVARILATGVFTHDHPLQAADLQALGLPIRVGVPELERKLMTLYPQPRGRPPAVEYVPGPSGPSLPARREVPRPTRREAPARAGGERV